MPLFPKGKLDTDDFGIQENIRRTFVPVFFDSIGYFVQRVKKGGAKLERRGPDDGNGGTHFPTDGATKFKRVSAVS